MVISIFPFANILLFSMYFCWYPSRSTLNFPLTSRVITTSRAYDTSNKVPKAAVPNITRHSCVILCFSPLHPTSRTGRLLPSKSNLLGFLLRAVSWSRIICAHLALTRRNRRPTQSSLANLHRQSNDNEIDHRLPTQWTNTRQSIWAVTIRLRRGPLGP